MTTDQCPGSLYMNYGIVCPLLIQYMPEGLQV